MLLFWPALHVAVCVFRGTWRRPSTRTTSTTRVASSCRTSTTTPTSCSSPARCGTGLFRYLTQRIKLLFSFIRSSFFPLFFVLTPSSRYVFRARASLNIHSFIHSFLCTFLCIFFMLSFSLSPSLSFFFNFLTTELFIHVNKN